MLKITGKLCPRRSQGHQTCDLRHSLFPPEDSIVFLFASGSVNVNSIQRSEIKIAPSHPRRRYSK